MSGWRNKAGRWIGLLALRSLGAGGCLFAALPSGCTKHDPAPGAPAPQILRISQRNEPADLDPAKASLPDELFIIRALSEGLVAPSPDNAPPQPAAAERWEISPDECTYTFHLRRNALWSNGEPVTAADFLASYQRVLTPATAAPKAPLLFLVKNARAFATGELTDFAAVGFRAPDPHTLVVTLEHPAPRFLAYAASGPWIPVNPRVVARFGRTWTRTVKSASGAWSLGPCARIGRPDEAGDRAERRQLLLRLVRAGLRSAPGRTTDRGAVVQ